MKKYSAVLFLLFLTCQMSAQNTGDDEVISRESQQKLDVKSYAFGLNTGMLNYLGDVAGDGSSSYFGVGNWALGISGEKKFGTNYGVLVNGVFGSVSKRGLYENNYINFRTRVTHVDVNVMLDTDNGNSLLSVFCSVGVGILNYSPKADLMSDGVAHYFWTDGTYRDMEQGTPGADTGSVVLVRDYDYETALDGGTSLTMPVWAGVKLKLTRQIDIRLAASYIFTFTDNLENITGGGNDRLFYASLGMSYNLVGADRSDKFRTINFSDLFNADSDNDGVKDKADYCQDTPEGISVDENGCPLDSDHDGVADYLDKEPATPANTLVDRNGVTLAEDEKIEPALDENIPTEKKAFKSTGDSGKPD